MVRSRVHNTLLHVVHRLPSVGATIVRTDVSFDQAAGCRVPEHNLDNTV